MVTHSRVAESIYRAMYYPQQWSQLTSSLYEVKAGDSARAAMSFESSAWQFYPERSCQPAGMPASDIELLLLVVCSDAYYAPEPNDTDWWESLWHSMTAASWIAKDVRFQVVFTCRHFAKF